MQSPQTPTLGYFKLHGGVRLDSLAELYALDLGEPGDATLSDLIRRLNEEPESGDRVAIGPVELVVLDAEDGEVRTAGLRFNAADPSRAARPHAARPRSARAYRVGRHRLSFPWPKNDGGQRRTTGA